ncbi:alkyl sulfatase dimerization domain-containing protein [Caulobacter sp. CCNWLY153]|uniref:alkyl/aryl-sulfatase n=1 Tax=unclassified Caulobacter TaxID=2648921 RepID=UPI002FEFDFF7
MRRPAMLCCTLIAAAGLSTGGHAASGDPDPADRRDFAFADQGFVATRQDPKILAADGRLVWDLDAYAFAKGPAPVGVNPSLWRQTQLLARTGLYKVTEGVWQVRGFDLANMTLIAGRTGWIIVDPLTSAETAKAALDLANAKLGARPVAAVIYSHSHVDHFGGVRGVLGEAEIKAGRTPIVAPEGFLEHAVSENVIAGPAMNRRGSFQFGHYLPVGLDGQMSSGLGLAVSRGATGLVAPNREIHRTGETLDLDGVRFVFQMTPGTEAPAEMNFFLPDLGVLCMSENANVSLHNVLTPRGAPVRDAKAWADGLSESLRLYGPQTKIIITGHGWPRFGAEEAADFLAKQRDAYKFLHDQSVRLMNQGLTGGEIANRLTLPPVLAREWYNRGYYGTVSFNARAVYQRYMGFYDGDPANLAPLDRADAARRYVEALGGRAAVLKRAAEADDLRWAVELLDRLVLADPTDREARERLAKLYDVQGRQAESAIWRNIYLSGAAELRGGVQSGPAATLPPDMLRNTPTALLLDLLAVRLDPARVGDGEAELTLLLTDRDEAFKVRVRHQVLTYEAMDPNAAVADPGVVRMVRPAFLAVALGGAAPSTGISPDLARLLSWIDRGRANFPLTSSAVTPNP